MIRLANAEDIPAIVELGRGFHEAAGLDDIAAFEAEDFATSLLEMVRNDAALLLIAENEGEIVGMAGAYSFPFYFNHAHKTAQELFWYIRPDSRNGIGSKLLSTLETEAKAVGCESLIMISLDHMSPEAVGRLYRRNGYRAAEHSYIRRL